VANGVEPDETPDLKFIYLGFTAILFNFLFFPSSFFYQARIITIFGGLLVASLTVLSVKIAIKNKDLNLKIKTGFLTIFLIVSGLWLFQINRTYAYAKNWPNNVWSAESISFDTKIKNIITGDKVIFKLLDDPNRYPMVASEDEYYTDAPILGFTDINDLIRDLTYLKNRSEFPFSAIIIADQKEAVRKIRDNLNKKTSRKIESEKIIDNKFVLIVPDYFAIPK
jgi:hypothetical protein